MQPAVFFYAARPAGPDFPGLPGMKKPCTLLYRDSSFRISISKRFKDKGFICIVHFLWLKYIMLFQKMIVYSLNEL